MDLVWADIQRALDATVNGTTGDFDTKPDVSYEIQGMQCELQHVVAESVRAEERPAAYSSPLVAAAKVKMLLSGGGVELAIQGTLLRWPRPDRPGIAAHHFEFTCTSSTTGQNGAERCLLIAAIPFLLAPVDRPLASMRPSDVGNRIYATALAWTVTSAAAALERPHSKQLAEDEQWDRAYTGAGISDALERLDDLNSSASWERLAADRNCLDTHHAADLLCCVLSNLQEGLPSTGSARRDIGVLLLIHRDIISTTTDAKGALLDRDVMALPVHHRAAAIAAVQGWHEETAPDWVRAIASDPKLIKTASEAALDAAVMGPHTLGFAQHMWANARALTPDGVRAHACVTVSPAVDGTCPALQGAGPSRMCTANELVNDDAMLTALFGHSDNMAEHLVAVRRHLQRALQLHTATSAGCYDFSARSVAYLRVSEASAPPELLVGDVVVMKVDAEPVKKTDVGRKLPFTAQGCDAGRAAAHIKKMAETDELLGRSECCFFSNDPKTPVLLVTVGVNEAAGDGAVQDELCDLVRAVSLQTDEDGPVVGLHPSFGKSQTVAASVQSVQDDNYTLLSLTSVAKGGFTAAAPQRLTLADKDEWTRPRELRKTETAYVTGRLLPFIYRAREVTSPDPDHPDAWNGPRAFNSSPGKPRGAIPHATPWGVFCAHAPSGDECDAAAAAASLKAIDRAAVCAQASCSADTSARAAIVVLKCTGGADGTVVFRKTKKGVQLLAAGPRQRRPKLEAVALSMVLSGHAPFGVCVALKAIWYKRLTEQDTEGTLHVVTSTPCATASETARVLLERCGAEGPMHTATIQARPCNTVRATLKYVALSTS